MENHTIRVDDETYKRLKKLGEEEHRPIANQAKWCVRRYPELLEVIRKLEQANFEWKDYCAKLSKENKILKEKLLKAILYGTD